MNQKKVTFILGSMGKGGAERVISILSREYAENGWQTDICALLFNTVEYELAPTTVFHDFSGGQDSRVKRVPYWLKTIRSFVKEQNPDVIVSFTARINVIVQIACIGLHKKIVVSERNDPKHDGRGLLTRIMTALLYPKTSAVVFQTERVRSYFGKSVQRKGVIIPNPIEVKAYATCADRDKIVTVGRLTLQKNHKLLISAFSQVLQLFPTKKLFIYGDGDMRDELKHYAVDLGVADSVVFAGKISNIHEAIMDASVFVLSSDYEGLSNALLEAMMMGLPCISTDCAGSDEYIENEKNGLLIPVGSVDALVKALIELFNNVELQKKCGENAKKVAEKVSLESTLKQWHKVIDV